MDELLKIRPRRHGRSLKEQLFESIQDKKDPSVSGFLWSGAILGSLSNEDLKQFTRRGFSPSRDGADILRTAVSHDKLDAVQMLLDRGWRWDSSSEDPVGSYIQSPAAWSLFLATGGDPFKPVEHDPSYGEPEVRPLWKHLLETSCFPSSDTGAHITQWAKIHAGSDLEGKEIQDYWKKLSRGGTQQEILQSIRARKDWPSLVSDTGENVLMVGMLSHLGVFEKLTAVEKAKGLFSHVDNSGWSIWHHLLRNGGKVSGAMWKTACDRAPVRPQEESGLLVSLLRKPDSLGQSSLPNPKYFQTVLSPGKNEAPQVDDWWAGTPEELARLGRYFQGDYMDELRRDRFYWGSLSASQGPGKGFYFSCSDVSKRLSALVAAFPPPLTLPPEVLGGIAINELVSVYSRVGSDRLGLCDSLIAAGASISLSQEAQEALDKAMTGLPDECQPRLKQLRMNHSLAPAAQGSSPRPRM